MWRSCNVCNNRFLAETSCSHDLALTDAQWDYAVRESARFRGVMPEFLLVQ